MILLSLTQVYLDILCHVTYILDTLQDDLHRHVSEQNSERSVLGHVDLSRLELDLFVHSHGDQARLLIPDSVCSDSGDGQKILNACISDPELRRRPAASRR